MVVTEQITKENLPKYNLSDLENIMDSLNSKPHERKDLCSDENFCFVSVIFYYPCCIFDEI